MKKFFNLYVVKACMGGVWDWTDKLLAVNIDEVDFIDFGSEKLIMKSGRMIDIRRHDNDEWERLRELCIGGCEKELPIQVIDGPVLDYIDAKRWRRFVDAAFFGDAEGQRSAVVINKPDGSAYSFFTKKYLEECADHGKSIFRDIC